MKVCPSGMESSSSQSELLPAPATEVVLDDAAPIFLYIFIFSFVRDLSELSSTRAAGGTACHGVCVKQGAGPLRRKFPIKSCDWLVLDPRMKKRVK